MGGSNLLGEQFQGTEGNKGKEAGLPPDPLELPRDLVKEIVASGVKVSPEKMVFALKVKLSEGETITVWLEKGGASAGLEHILIGHAKNFFDKYGIGDDEISKFIYDTLKANELLSSRPNDRGGLDRLFKTLPGKTPLLVAISTNGFIVNAFPYSHGTLVRQR